MSAQAAVKETATEHADAAGDHWLSSDAALSVRAATEPEKNFMRFAALTLLLCTQLVTRTALAVDLYDEQYRPQFHFSAKQGWLNDPNGLVYQDGQYHLFYQHNPFGNGWGNMSWGHATSTDLVRWTERSPAIVGDPSGVKFSGSAVIDHANTAGLQTGSTPTMALFYTSVGSFDQRMAYSTDGGRSFRYSTDNPVLGSVSGHDDRDPQVFWHEGSQKWVQALWVAAHEGKPQSVSFFGSTNLTDWNYLSETPHFFECPDFFELSVDGNANNKRWVLYGADGQYQVGAFDGTQFTAQTPAAGKIIQDYGGNFYAAQTWHDVPSDDGRRIQVAWMNGANYPGMPFNQQMSFPVELTLRSTSDGLRMFRNPVAEIESLYETEHQLSNVSLLPGQDPLGNLAGDLFHIKTEIALGSATSVGFNIRGSQVRYDVASQTLSALGRSAPLAATNGKIQLELLVDRSSLEVFGGGGRVSLTSGFTPSAGNMAIDLFATGGNAQVVSLSAFELGSSWPDSQPVPANDLIGRWRFDDPTNAAGFVDDAGNDFGLANSGMVAGLPGVAGSAADFDNAGDYGFVPDNAAMNAESFSVSLWVRPDSIGQLRHIVGKTQATQGSWGLEQQSDGRVKFFVQSETGVVDSIESDVVLSPTDWHHAVASYNAEIGRLELYVNGKFAGANEGVISGPPKFDTSPLMIGLRRVGSGGELGAINGKIDEMQLYGSALTPGQVGFLHNHPEVAVEPGSYDVGSLKLLVDTETGEASIVNGGASTQLKGYSLLSNQGSLESGDWQSFQDRGQPQFAGWEEANPTPFALSELNPLGSMLVGAGGTLTLGNPVEGFAAAEFGKAIRNTDFAFEYTTADGSVLQGEVEFTGRSAINNLLVTVNPETGAAELTNSSGRFVRIRGYSILSESGSLQPGGWLSLSDQAMPGVDEANASTENLSELIPFAGDAVQLAPGQEFSLGSPFQQESAGGERDLEFEFLLEQADPLAGDFNQDGVVDGGDFTVWRDKFGSHQALPNESATPGMVSIEDYQTWKSNFGATANVELMIFTGVVKYGALSGGGSAAGSQVPEPGTAGLALLALAAAAMGRLKTPVVSQN